MSKETTAQRTSIHYLKTIGIVNNNPLGRGFAHPVDLAVGNEGRIYVLNRHAGFTRVGVCTIEEEYLNEFGSYGHGDGQFWLPTAVALDNKERVYVADEYHNNISVFETSGKFVGNWGSYGTRDGEFDGPSGITIDSDNNIFIVDQNNNRVQKFNTDGEYLSQWGQPGQGEGQFNLPWGITLDSESNVYVADWRNDRIQKFTPDGEFVDQYGESGTGDGQFHRPSKPAVDSDGYIYVADWGNERVQVLDPDGEFQLNLRGEATLSQWAQEFLDANPDESVERDKSNLMPDLPDHFNTPYLISTQIESYFWGPASVNLDNQGRLYVTESARHRVQVYGK